MKRRYPVLLIALVGVFLGAAFPQDAALAPDIDLPKFFLDALSYKSDEPEKSRLDVYVQLPYEMLSFTKVGDTYRAQYEVTASIYDSSNALVTEKIWNENVETKDYHESVSKRYGKMSQKSFFLKPSLYTLSVQVRDNETRKTARLRRPVIVKEFTSSLTLSDIMLVKRTSKEGDRTAVYPNVTGMVNEPSEGFTIFFEVYNQTDADSAEFRLNVQGAKSEVVWSDSMKQSIAQNKNACFMKVESQGFTAGNYVIELKTFLRASAEDSSQRRTVATASRSFSIRMKGLPSTITDLDRAIDQMQYVAEKEELEEMKKGSPEEKQKHFFDFWKKRDPTPETELNELMEEYFQRVEYANKNYSHYLEGWKTDRGMVYIIFGPPSNIDRHPFDVDAKPYEVWTYYELNREFVFVDATGFGDYRLQYPIWDTWRTRYR
jgi:GWxTD domain-containing protein